MTDSYKIWKPEHDGHAPPNWREGMKWTDSARLDLFDGRYSPNWRKGCNYYVEPEALNSPNDDAADEYKERQLAYILEDLRQYSPELLAKHGITLATEKDWATELWADLMDAWDMHETAELVRRGAHGDAFVGPINLIRTRFEQMKGAR